ncbi:hypothetical protein NEOC65_001400 [Neochlamydia sp. AcF65]|nr:hypothetical protein [Neochlamydia sp. AcF65]MBS4171651.1 hypothetical protein [Neochlamydia sp. AcF95]
MFDEQLKLVKREKKGRILNRSRPKLNKLASKGPFKNFTIKYIINKKLPLY